MTKNMKSKNYLFLIVYLVITLANNSYAQNISEWRGYGRTGVYDETGLLKV